MTTDAQDQNGLKPHERQACSHPGCRARGNFASFKDDEGRQWCISHNPDKLPKLLATQKGAAMLRRPQMLTKGSPSPSFRTREDVVSWSEDMAGLVLRGELDPRLSAEARGHALLALAAHDLAARDLLEKLHKVVNVKARRA